MKKEVFYMQIIIVGGGSVGFALAELLAAENQDVIVIEKNAEKIKRLSLELGTMVIEDT
ncbi:MAG: NAD(P)-binding domain-containing protein, partial [Firmicutes bacterium]|nr:NAD(P)-binding domain-containing protein [Bacillota bacterium]